MRAFIIILLSGGVLAGAAAEQPPVALLPYSPSMRTDSRGHDWFVEQNGILQRSGDAPSMVGNCGALQIAGQSFYPAQAQVTTDGGEIRMTSQQSMGGISVTRTITFMDREGGLRYVDQLTNTTTRDLQVAVELRHGFNSSAREVLSDLGKVFKNGLEAGEAGLAALPQDPEGKTPALLIIARDPRSETPVKIRVQNKYQVMMTFSVAVPAGESRFLVHALGQVNLPPSADAGQVMRAFSSLRLDKLAKGLPKSVVKWAVNLGGPAVPAGLEFWSPKDYWGLVPGDSDQLALGKGSLLKGRMMNDRLSWKRGGVSLGVPRSRVAAVSGPAFDKDGRTWLWMTDGQRWLGSLDPPELRFTLNNAAELPVKNLDRLVLARMMDEEKKAASLLVEMKDGERLAVVLSGDVPLKAAWGRLVVPWSGVLACQRLEGREDSLFFLRSGTRIFALPEQARIKMKTKDWGEQEYNAGEVSRLISPEAGDQEDDPAVSFVELVNDQRIVGRVTAARMTLLTEAGPLTLAPSVIRELREAGDDAEGEGALFEAELWGGGVVTGPLEAKTLPLEGEGFRWEIPVRQVTRLVNPLPVADNALMRRIGQLIEELGHEQWKVREAATTALREMGPPAHAGLREALKSATDAEVARRLEELLQE